MMQYRETYENGELVKREEIESCPAILNAQIDMARKAAYQEESDPLMAKWLRGEVEKQVWLDKVADIRLRFPTIQVGETEYDTNGLKN